MTLPPTPSRRARPTRAPWMAAVLAVALAVALLAPFARAAAQRADSLPPAHAEYLERAYLLRNVPGGKTGEHFEALLPLHIALYDDVQGAYDRVLQGDATTRRTLAAHFSMVVHLRMTTESSAPVRTPSYMPKLTLGWHGVRRAGTGPGRTATAVTMWSIPFVPYGHYSNGQDGCLFAFQARAASPGGGEAPCVDTAAVPRRGRVRASDVNRKDGSFSGHYVQVGYFHRWIALDPDAAPGPYLGARALASVGASVRAYQPYYWLGGGMSRELRALYGPTRVRTLANRITQRDAPAWRPVRWMGPGQLRLEGVAEWLPGASPEVDPVRVTLELARTMDRRGGWGFFTRYHSGQDDYNLGFLTQLRVVQVGVTAGGERMAAFRL